jgi:hypothetical protein
VVAEKSNYTVIETGVMIKKKIKNHNVHGQPITGPEDRSVPLACSLLLSYCDLFPVKEFCLKHLS